MVRVTWNASFHDELWHQPVQSEKDCGAAKCHYAPEYFTTHASLMMHFKERKQIQKNGGHSWKRINNRQESVILHQQELVLLPSKAAKNIIYFCTCDAKVLSGKLRGRITYQQKRRFSTLRVLHPIVPVFDFNMISNSSLKMISEISRPLMILTLRVLGYCNFNDW